MAAYSEPVVPILNDLGRGLAVGSSVSHYEALFAFGFEVRRDVAIGDLLFVDKAVGLSHALMCQAFLLGSSDLLDEAMRKLELGSDLDRFRRGSRPLAS